jgi:tetratricopeptide (TPR) repeat protein
VSDATDSPATSVASAPAPSASRVRRRRSRLALVLLGLALGVALFAAAELTVRLLHLGERHELHEFATASGPFVSCDPDWQKLVAEEGDVVDRVACARVKPAGTWRVVVVGESTVAGFPFHPYVSFARLLEASLRDDFPGLDVEVVNFGRVAEPSETVARVALEALELRPDVLVVSSGHNELGGSSADSARDGLWPRVREQLRRLRLVQLASPTQLEMPAPTGEVTPVIRDSASLSSTQIERITSRFRDHLAAVVDAARDRAVDVALVTQASNLRDYAPNASHFTRRHSDAERREFEQKLAELEAAADATLVPRDARKLAMRLGELDSGVARATFLVGRLRERAGEAAVAAACYALARDQDDVPNRTPSALNAAITSLASERGVALVDAVHAFDRAASVAPGAESFLDYCHPTLEGACRLADAVRPVVVAALARRGAPLPAVHADRAMLDRAPLAKWLERLHVTAKQLGPAYVQVGEGNLMVALRLTANRESLELADHAFRAALELEPTSIEALRGQVVLALLREQRDATLDLATKLLARQPDALRQVEDLLRASPSVRAALAKTGLELREGRLVSK